MHYQEKYLTDRIKKHPLAPSANERARRVELSKLWRQKAKNSEEIKLMVGDIDMRNSQWGEAKPAKEQSDSKELAFIENELINKLF
jgi:hypothetical protein